MSATRVLCLCCGEQYDLGDDCANVERVEHSVAIAADVARRLLALDVKAATSRDVKRVLAARETIERVDELLDG